MKKGLLSLVTTIIILTTAANVLAGTVPPENPCKGWCYSDPYCQGPESKAMTDIPCWECMNLGGYWKPNKDSLCFCDYPRDLCLNECPECSDNIDNDGDGHEDFGDTSVCADPQCVAGLDDSEKYAGCQPYPFTEAPALSLIGLIALAGSLGLVAAVMIRRR